MSGVKTGRPGNREALGCFEESPGSTRAMMLDNVQ